MINFPTDVRDPQFVAKITLFSNQQKQAADNLKTHDEYVSYAATWVATNTKQVQQGLPPTAPKPVPLQTVYNDDFTVSHPPFPDLTLPTINPAEITVTQNPFGAGSGPGFAGVNPSGQTSDTQAILMMLSHVIAELDLVKAKVGA